ncbi:MAG: BF3164 family lipoprotein [Mangrovibacterium sp.]
MGIFQYKHCNLSLTPIETIEGFLCNISVNPQDGRICLSYNLTDLIEFYDSDGILKKRVHGPDHFFPVIEQRERGEGVGVRSIEGKTRDAYFSPVVSDSMIYLLYSGRFFDLNVTESLYLVNQIFAFDWDGTPSKRFILDIPIFWFTVDEKQKKIYGLTDVPDFRVIEYQF